MYLHNLLTFFCIAILCTHDSLRVCGQLEQTDEESVLLRTHLQYENEDWSFFSTDKVENEKALQTLAECLKETEGDISDLELWISCKEKTEERSQFSSNAALESESTRTHAAQRAAVISGKAITPQENAADVSWISTLVILVFIIAFISLWQRPRSVVPRKKTQMKEDDGSNEEHTGMDGTDDGSLVSAHRMADMDKAKLASSLGRAFALVMAKMEQAGRDGLSEIAPESLAEVVKGACQESILPVLGHLESHKFSNDLASAFKEIHLVTARINITVTDVNAVQHGISAALPKPSREGRVHGQQRSPHVGDTEFVKSNSMNKACNGTEDVCFRANISESNFDVRRWPESGCTKTSVTAGSSGRLGEGRSGSGAEDIRSALGESKHSSEELDTSDGEPPHEWIQEQRQRVQNLDREGLSDSIGEAGAPESGTKSVESLAGGGDPLYALLPVGRSQMVVSQAGRIMGGEGGGDGANVFERLASAYEQRNQLTMAKLRLGSRQLDVQSQHLDLTLESNSLMRSNVEIGHRRNEQKERAASEQKAGEALRALVLQLADELVTGLWIMVAALMAAGWWFAKSRLREELAVCYRSVQTPRGWFNVWSWSSQWVNEAGCQMLIFGRLGCGLAILVLFSSILVHRDVADMQRRPVFMIVFVMGILGGVVGNTTVESVGGVGLRWLVCWEALCAFHVAGVWYPKQVYLIVNSCHPDDLGGGGGDRYGRHQDRLWSKVRKLVIHAVIVLVLPLAAGLWPFFCTNR